MIQKCSIIFTLSCSLLFGCQSAPEPIKLPTWVLNPPQDNNTTMYGVASGYNIDSAKASALQDISAKLGISLKGSTEVSEQSSNSRYSNYLNNQINITQDDIVISRYQLEEAAVVANNQVYALVSIKKLDLQDDNQKQLMHLNKKAKDRLSLQKQESAFKWNFESKKLLNSDLSKAIRFASIVQILDNKTSVDKLLSPWNSLTSAVNKSSASVCLKINPANKTSQPFAETIESYVIAQDIKVFSNCTNELSISAKTNRSILFEQYLAKTTLLIKLNTKTEGTLASNNIVISGKSVSNYDTAVDASIRALQNKLDQNSLWQLIGL